MQVLGSALKRIGVSIGILTVAIASGGINTSARAVNADDALYAQNTDSPTQADYTTRFSCQIDQGQYTVMYNPQSQPDEFYPWAKPQTLGGGWSAERRCAEISRRLESYRPDGLLEMQTGIENGYDIVCVTTEADPNCRIVFTVPPGQDAELTRDRVFENLAVADSGQQTDAVNTYRGNGAGEILSQIGQELGINLPSASGGRRPESRNIDLRPFLDPADGGTGTQLRGGSSFDSSPTLNPDNFR
jgi:hypothetical protein